MVQRDKPHLLLPASTMNHMPSMDDRSVEENQARKLRLVETLKSGEAILVVGAGCSCAAGFPSWTSLLKQLESFAVEIDPTFVARHNPEHEALKYAAEMKECIKRNQGNLDQYHARLGSIFRPKDSMRSELHRILVSLPCRGIVTTNYDSLLSFALRCVEVDTRLSEDYVVFHEAARLEISRFVQSLVSPDHMKQVLHIHGHYTRPNEIVLCENDFQQAYPDGFGVTVGSLRRKLLWSLFSTRPTIFVGFSLSDPYFMTLLSLVVDDLWTWDNPRHYAILPSDDNHNAIELERRYGVSPVFYDNSAKNHLKLEPLLRSLQEGCAPPGSSYQPSGKALVPALHGEVVWFQRLGAILTDWRDGLLSSLRRRLNLGGEPVGTETSWLEAANLRMEERAKKHEN